MNFPDEQGQANADPPIRIAVVGLRFGMSVCHSLVDTPNLPVRLIKVYDLDGDKVRAATEELGVPAAASLDELLRDPDVDAIGLYTPPVERARLIQKIVRAGKHVMTTKPFELDPVAAIAVLEEAAGLGRVVHLNAPGPRPIGEAAVIDEWVRSGAIGRITVAQANTWVYYGATPADGSWYDDPARCPVAPVFRLGIYPLTMLLDFFQAPSTVQVTHARVETLRPTPDNVSVTIGFNDGAIINVLSSFVVGSGPDRYRGGITIGGTKGRIYVGIGPARRDAGPAADLILSTDDRLEYRSVEKHYGDYDWDFFARRIRGELSTDITTPEKIASAIRLVNAMSEAERTGETVRIE